jgi:hypothetical protein
MTVFDFAVPHQPRAFSSLCRRAGSGLLLIGLLSLAPESGASDHPAEPACSDGSQAASGERGELNKGYTLLYDEAVGLAKARFLLKVKDQPTDVESMVTAATDEYLRLQQQMEGLAKDFPALKLDAPDIMAKVIAETREAIGTDQFKSFAPLVGQSGVEYERNLLLLFENALNEQRHLTKVLADAEPDAALKKFDEAETTRLDALYARVLALLDRHYFKG